MTVPLARGSGIISGWQVGSPNVYGFMSMSVPVDFIAPAPKHHLRSLCRPHGSTLGPPYITFQSHESLQRDPSHLRCTHPLSRKACKLTNMPSTQWVPPSYFRVGNTIEGLGGLGRRTQLFICQSHHLLGALILSPECTVLEGTRGGMKETRSGQPARLQANTGRPGKTDVHIRWDTRPNKPEMLSLEKTAPSHLI